MGCPPNVNGCSHMAFGPLSSPSPSRTKPCTCSYVKGFCCALAENVTITAIINIKRVTTGPCRIRTSPKQESLRGIVVILPRDAGSGQGGASQCMALTKESNTLIVLSRGEFALALRWGPSSIQNPDAPAREHSNQRVGYAITSCSSTRRRISKSDCGSGARRRVAGDIKVLALLGFDCAATL